VDKVVYIYSDILGFSPRDKDKLGLSHPPKIAYFLGSYLKIVQNRLELIGFGIRYLYVYPVTNETKWDKVPNVPLEEMGTNHLRSINLRFVSCWFVSLSLFCFVKGN
jgi:hypothetical protein